MRRVLVLLVGIALGSSPLVAQTVASRPAILFGGGIAGQYDGGRDLGSPGLTASVAVQWAVSPAIGLRLEAQGFEYGDQELPAEVGVQGSAESIGAISALVAWMPRPDARLYLLGGGALARARVTGSAGATTGAAVMGMGIQIVRYAGLELQYLHAVRLLGETRSALAARVLLRF